MQAEEEGKEETVECEEWEQEPLPDHSFEEEGGSESLPLTLKVCV